MPAVLDKKQPFLSLIEQFDPGSNHFAALRQQARQRFRDLSFPTSRTEDWRFTSVTSLLDTPFAPAELPKDLSRLPLPGPVADDALRLTFVNGHFVPSLSILKDVPRGLILGNLANPRPEAAKMVESHLGRLVDYRDQVFPALNTALLADGAYVVVLDEAVIERPIDIVYLSTPGQPRTASQPRTLIAVQPGAQVRIAERYLAAGEYFTNAVTEIAVGAGAVVDHYKVQEESLTAHHLASTQIVLQGGGKFTSQYVALGGKLVRNEVHVRFEGQHAEATVNGLYLGTGTQHLDNFTVIDHAQPHCASHELYKGILDGQASAVFNGKIFVRPDAQKTDAKQTNKALLLSDSATINTKPQLEIFADDVKCTHGATVGQLDAEQLYYLRSRGIGLREAQNILTFAFANDIVRRIQPEGLRNYLESILLNRQS